MNMQHVVHSTYFGAEPSFTTACWLTATPNGYVLSLRHPHQQSFLAAHDYANLGSSPYGTTPQLPPHPQPQLQQYPQQQSFLADHDYANLGSSPYGTTPQLPPQPQPQPQQPYLNHTNNMYYYNNSNMSSCNSSATNSNVINNDSIINSSSSSSSPTNNNNNNNNSSNSIVDDVVVKAFNSNDNNNNSGDSSDENDVVKAFRTLLKDQLKIVCAKMRKTGNTNQAGDQADLEEEPQVDDEEQTLRVEDFAMRKRRGKAVTEKVSEFVFEIDADDGIFEEMVTMDPKAREEAEKLNQKWMPFAERLQGWIVERRGRNRNENVQCDMYYHHKPSKGQFKSKNELIDFVINNKYPNYQRSQGPTNKTKTFTFGSSSWSVAAPPKKRGRKSKQEKFDSSILPLHPVPPSTVLSSSGRKRPYNETQLGAIITAEDIEVANIVASLNQGMFPDPASAYNYEDGGRAYGGEKKEHELQVIGPKVGNGKNEEVIVIDLDSTDDDDDDDMMEEHAVIDVDMEKENDAPNPEEKTKDEAIQTDDQALKVAEGAGVVVGSSMGSPVENSSFIDVFDNTFELGGGSGDLPPVLDMTMGTLGEGMTAAWTDTYDDIYNSYDCYQDYYDYHNYRREEALAIEQSLATLTAGDSDSTDRSSKVDQGSANVNFNAAAAAATAEGGGNPNPNPNPSLDSMLHFMDMVAADLHSDCPSFEGLEDIAGEGFDFGSSSCCSNIGGGSQSVNKVLTLEDIFNDHF